MRTEKEVPYLSMSAGHSADPGFLASQPAGDIVSCRYFPPGSWLVSQSKRSPHLDALPLSPSSIIWYRPRGGDVLGWKSN